MFGENEKLEILKLLNIDELNTFQFAM